MANPTTGLFDTVTAAFNEGAQSLKFQNTMLSSVFLGHKPIANGTIGETININVPIVNEGDVIDIGAGEIQVVDTAHNTFSLQFAHKASEAHILKSFDQIRSPQDFRQLYGDAWLESILRKVNRDVCNLVTSTNFNTYSSITGGADTFTRANLLTAWNNLAGGGVPVDDTPNLSFVTSNLPYSNMLADTNFYQESIVGRPAAETAIQKAVIALQSGATVKWDQQFPQPTAGATYTGLFFHRYAIGMRFGTEAPMGGHVQEAIVYPRPMMPVKVQVWPSGEKQGMVVHLSCCYGLAVVRPEFGSYLVST